MTADAAFVVARRAEILLEQVIGSGQIRIVVAVKQTWAVAVRNLDEMIDGGRKRSEI